MHELTLYHALFSTCSQKVRYALGKKQLSYKSRIVDLSKGEHLEDWYLEINPNGVVPSLIHNGNAITDSSVICEYLDEVFPDPPLTPSDAVAKAAMRTWMRYFEEVPTAAIRAPSFNALFAKGIASRGEEENRRQRDKMPLRRHFYAKLGKEGFPQSMIDESIERLVACLSRVDKATAGGGPFLLGEQLTIADITLLPSIVRMDDLGMTELWQNKRGVSRWYGMMLQDDAFEVAYMPGARIKRPA